MIRTDLQVKPFSTSYATQRQSVAVTQIATKPQALEALPRFGAEAETKAGWKQASGLYRTIQALAMIWPLSISVPGNVGGYVTYGYLVNKGLIQATEKQINLAKTFGLLGHPELLAGLTYMLFRKKKRRVVEHIAHELGHLNTFPTVEKQRVWQQGYTRYKSVDILHVRSEKAKQIGAGGFVKTSYLGFNLPSEGIVNLRPDPEYCPQIPDGIEGFTLTKDEAQQFLRENMICDFAGIAMSEALTGNYASGHAENDIQHAKNGAQQLADLEKADWNPIERRLFIWKELRTAYKDARQAVRSYDPAVVRDVYETLVTQFDAGRRVWTMEDLKPLLARIDQQFVTEGNNPSEVSTP